MRIKLLTKEINPESLKKMKMNTQFTFRNQKKKIN